MGFFKFLFGSKSKNISDKDKSLIADNIISLAKECTANLENIFMKPAVNGDFEIFMLNLEFFTQFLIDYDHIFDENDFRNLLVFKLHSSSYNPLKTYTLNEFFEFYTSRAAIINYEVSSLTKSFQSGGKAFLPVHSYVSIYKTPLVNKPNVDFADFNDVNAFSPLLMEKAADFMLKYADHLHYIATKINIIYKSN